MDIAELIADFQKLDERQRREVLEALSKIARSGAVDAIQHDNATERAEMAL